MPHITAKQASALLDMSAALGAQVQALNTARTQLTLAALGARRNDAAIPAKVDAVVAAETALARARADAFGRLQATANRLDAEQVAWLVTSGGAYGPSFTEPEP